MKLPEFVYALVSLKEGDGIIAANGMPLVVLGTNPEMMRMIKEMGEELTKSTGKPIALLRFKNPEIINNFNVVN